MLLVSAAPLPVSSSSTDAGQGRALLVCCVRLKRETGMMQAWSYIPHRQGPLPATRLVTNRYPPPSICGHGRRGSDHAVLYNGDSKPRHTVLNRWHPGWVKRSRVSLDQLCVSRLVVGPGRAIKRY